MPSLYRRLLAGAVFIFIVLAVALLYLTTFTRDRFGPQIGKYIETLLDGRTREAYESTCSRFRLSIALEQFSERAIVQLAFIGDVERVDSLRGERRVASFAITGEHRTVHAAIPVEREEGQWKACPIDQPLGVLRPAP